MELHSPTGTVSKLAVPNEDARDRRLRTTFRFGSARHLGEDPSGEWTLKLTDRLAGQEGSIGGWSIKVYGHGEGAGTQKASNSPATGAPGISGKVRVGATLSADVSSVDDWNGMRGAAFSYQWIRNDRTADTDTDIPGATEATYTLVADDEVHAIKVRVSFTDDAGYLETLTSRATEPLLGPNTPATGLPTISGTARVGETLTANTSGIADENGLENITFTYQWLADDTHDGQNGFTFELRFSEEFSLSYKTLRDQAFTVAGGTVEKAKRITKGSNLRWLITVMPDGDGQVAITLPVTEDCDAEGAICTGDGRMLSNELVLTVSAPGDRPAPGRRPALYGQQKARPHGRAGEANTARCGLFPRQPGRKQ